MFTVPELCRCIPGDRTQLFRSLTTDLSESTASCVVSALAELGEGIGLAEIRRAQPISMGVISGRDARFGGAPYVNQLVLAVTGGPGAPSADGWLRV